MQSLMPMHRFLFEIQIIKNSLTGPISYRVFRETGPCSFHTILIRTILFYANFNTYTLLSF